MKKDPMRSTPALLNTLSKTARTLIMLALGTASLTAQNMPPRQPTIPARPATPAPTRPAQTGQVFRGGTDILTIDVVPRDAKGAFIPTLGMNDFQIFEDGVEQKIQAFVRANGGQFFNSYATAAATRVEGLVLPKTAPPPDTAGRIFIIFIDDLHFPPSQTPVVREMLKLVRDTLVHENDLVGFVSSGFSSIAMDPAYDFQHKRFNEAINKTVGSGPKIQDMITMTAGTDGIAELNHNIGTAFTAVTNLLTQMEGMTGKRKAFIWLSNGFDLGPFKDSRLRTELERYARIGACGNPEDDPSPFAGEEADPRPRNDPCRYVDADMAQIQNVRIGEGEAGFNLTGSSTLQWTQSQLMARMADLITAAQRANTSFNMLDPRGLMTGLNDASMQQQLSNQEETEFMINTVGTLQALAENTGGIACVRTNDCRSKLQQIDNMTSDYYMIGFRSTNPDPFKLARKIEIKVKRPDVVLVPGKDYKDTYYLKKPQREKK
jgi:VWFA-related protein